MLINDTWLKFVPCLTILKQKPIERLCGLPSPQAQQCRRSLRWVCRSHSYWLWYSSWECCLEGRDSARCPLAASPTLVSPQGLPLLSPQCWREQQRGQLLARHHAAFQNLQTPAPGSKAGAPDHHVPPVEQGRGTVIPPKSNIKNLAALSCSLLVDTFKKHYKCQAP